MKTLLLLAALALPHFASAADERSGPPIFTKLNAKVGSWGEYSFERKKGDEVVSKGTFRMAVVGKEGDNVWLEQKMTAEIPKPKKDRGPMTMKMLIGKEKVEKVFMKSERGVVEMTGMMGFSARRPHEESEKTKMKELGTETISVPAGSFKTTRYSFDHEKKAAGDVWVKPGVGPYGLVKQVFKSESRDTAVVLTAHGDDAKSEVDHTTAKSMGAGMPRGKGEKMPEGMDQLNTMPAGMPADMLKKMMRKKAGLE